MLLQRLKEYQDQHPETTGDTSGVPPEYKVQAIPWVIHLDLTGEVAHFIRTTGQISRSGRDAGRQFAAPFLRRSGTNVKPQLLADKAEFVLGLAAEDAPQRAARRHAEFVALVEACSEETGDSRVRAALNFLQALPNPRLQLPSDLMPSDFVTFQVEEERPIDVQPVREFWANTAPRLRERAVPQLSSELVLSWRNATAETAIAKCLVCGEVKPIARIHPVPIRLPRSVSDQQVSIVSANKEAFWSYGLEQSFLAPTCTQCAEAYGRAVNQLARSERNSLVLAKAIFIFWTREEVGFDFLTFLSDPQPEEVRGLLESVRRGGRMPEVDDTKFYATVLSGSGGRAVVRDWLDTTVGEVKENLAGPAGWFPRQSIVGPDGEEPQPFPVVGYFHRERKRWVDGLVESLVPEIQGRRDPGRASPSIAPALLRSALTGAPLPPGLLYQVVRRNRAEQGVTRPRAALIKLVLLSNETTEKEDSMVQLDPDNPSAAYRCGRLFAELEQAQKKAIRGINQTIADRFFGSASSAPASVFARLLAGNKPHLSKLARDQPSVAAALQRRIEDILAGLPSSGFPRTLTLMDQGVFALGYYHQRAFDRAQAKEASERRKAGAAQAADEIVNDEELTENQD